MKRPSVKQWATAMTASTVVLSAACAILGIATVGMFFYHFAAKADLRYQYANGANHCTTLTSQYTRHFETHGTWPAPGTYSEDTFEYKSTITLSTGEREDVYRADYDGGMEVHFELREDGTIRAWPFPG